ncbi:MAG TPA: GAF domain-containing protein, partial [Aggregatilineaceae bacterium]|nr:GAF domain-containing protein [Aggregatilineaceae bacterium]
QGEEGYGYLVTEDGQLLAFSNLALVREGKRISQKPSEIEDGTFYGLFSLYKGLEDRWIVASSTPLEFVPWYAVVEQPAMEPLSGVIVAFGIFVLVLLLSLVLAISIERFVRRGVVKPLAQLREGARVFASGNLDHHIEVAGSLELRDLSTALNDMASDLKQSHAEVAESNRTLEQRVREQTRNLALVTEVTNKAASILEMQELLQMVADLTTQTFNLYHAHVYVLDGKTESLVLAAGAGEVGRRMATQGHQIPLRTDRSVVARAAREHSLVTVDDVRLSPDFLPNPMLPQTISELAVALTVGDEVMGVLDVQSDKPAQFDAELSNLMSTLAGQIAVALRNAQLYTEAERSSRHERALSVITEQLQSASTLDEVLQIAVRELGKALRVPQATVALQLPTELSEEPEFTHG